MNTEKVSIELSDGTKIENLSMNGNNFVSNVEVLESAFEDNLDTVKITIGDSTETHSNMRLVQITKMGDEWWFILEEISKRELKDTKMQSDIAYVAMMTGVDL